MSSTHSVAVGDKIGGRYLVEAVLGEGGMAIVFRAQHTGTRKACALKIIHAHLAARPGLVERFTQEAQVGARIGSSPYIVEVFDTGVDDLKKVPFLAMELLTGETLQHMLARGEPLDPSLTRTVLEQLGEALDQAHSAGVVHRDLKPSNLFVTRDARRRVVTKVLDFGIAKVLEGDAQHTATEIGTPMYAAPEQLGPVFRDLAMKQGVTVAREITPATDIWALGLIAYEMLVGVGPGHYWEATTASDLSLRMALAIQARPKATARAGARAALLPEGFDAWMDRCLEIDAKRRWPSAAQAVEALSALIARAPAAAVPHPRPDPVLATSLGSVIQTHDPNADRRPAAADTPPELASDHVEHAPIVKTAIADGVRTFEPASRTLPTDKTASKSAPGRSRTPLLAAAGVAVAAFLAVGLVVALRSPKTAPVATVGLVDAVTGLQGDAPATITLTPGGATSTITPSSSAVFAMLPPSSTYQVKIGAPYLAESSELRLDDRGAGALVLRSIQLRDIPKDADGPEPGKRLFLELNGTHDPVLRWISGEVVHAIQTIPPARLAEEVTASWKTYGTSRGAADSSKDQAILLVHEGTPVDRVIAAAQALTGVLRDVEAGGKKSSVPAFSVTVARPKPSTRTLPPEPDLSAADKVSSQQIRWGAITVNGRLMPNTILSTIQEKTKTFSACYGTGLGKNPSLAGRVSVRFVIGADGSIANVSNAGSDLPDPDVVQCIVGAYQRMTFPKPEGGIVTVVMPVSLSPRQAEVVARQTQNKSGASARVSNQQGAVELPPAGGKNKSVQKSPPTRGEDPY